jgi:hypothetical protein
VISTLTAAIFQTRNLVVEEISLHRRIEAVNKDFSA